jgi:hypothetical protein
MRIIHIVLSGGESASALCGRWDVVELVVVVEGRLIGLESSSPCRSMLVRPGPVPWLSLPTAPLGV